MRAQKKFTQKFPQSYFSPFVHVSAFLYRVWCQEHAAVPKTEQEQWADGS